MVARHPQGWAPSPTLDPQQGPVAPPGSTSARLADRLLEGKPRPRDTSRVLLKARRVTGQAPLVPWQEILGVEDRVQYVSQYTVSPCAQLEIGCGG